MYCSLRWFCQKAGSVDCFNSLLLIKNMCLSCRARMHLFLKNTIFKLSYLTSVYKTLAAGLIQVNSIFMYTVGGSNLFPVGHFNGHVLFTTCET